ncbi:MAG TPA: serine hydrolase domain-containing protein [Gemmatimonadaceae bacterium]|nr:serine hydrolase domain-containing protein [Gemmatimonadaceae bacterium]
MRPARRTIFAATALVSVTAAAVAPARSSAQGRESSGTQAAPSRAEVRARVDSLAKAFLAEPQSPGLSIAVIRAGRDTLVYEGYGKSDLENGVAATPATVYRIGSITKQFTAAAVMRLVEKGSVHLGDSIGMYLPDLPKAWRPVKVRQLLNHTSGIPSYTDLGESWAKRWGEHMSPDTLVALTGNKPMDFPPGTGWRYDNTGYVVLGMLLEKVTGKPYAEYLDSTLFQPLGLTHTLYCDRAPLVPHRARGYQRDDGKFTNAPYIDMSQPYAAGALCSTVGDLARWNRLLATGKVVSPASYARMTTPEGNAGLNHYGFGLVRSAVGSHIMIEHGGGIHGFITSNAYFPADSLSITVLTNATPTNPDALLANIARAVFGIPLVQPVQAAKQVPLPDSVRVAVQGKYNVDLGAKKMLVTFFVDSTGMQSQAEGQQPFPIYYAGDLTFAAKIDPSIRIRFHLDHGRATGVTLDQGGSSHSGPRVE